MELGNAFSEIKTRPSRPSFHDARSEREAGDVLAEEGDPDYVEALSYGMPPTGGLGLGIDRLAMVLTGRETIRDVVLFPDSARYLGGESASPGRHEFFGTVRAIDLPGHFSSLDRFA